MRSFPLMLLGVMHSSPHGGNLMLIHLLSADVLSSSREVDGMFDHDVGVLLMLFVWAVDYCWSLPVLQWPFAVAAMWILQELLGPVLLFLHPDACSSLLLQLCLLAMLCSGDAHDGAVGNTLNVRLLLFLLPALEPKMVLLVSVLEHSDVVPCHATVLVESRQRLQQAPHSWPTLGSSLYHPAPPNSAYGKRKYPSDYTGPKVSISKNRGIIRDRKLIPSSFHQLIINNMAIIIITETIYKITSSKGAKVLPVLAGTPTSF
ncbi:hypothetical protein Nepgr_020396 [Nepenthes gracilis]|uniref:Uncharacterized protein n=1 Tax=Nepenthes gracilis TaxID=150966 RepID=A0AAD3XW87_NEPGR|nr:hypothetical protein Nepgr_020396 [Nepenthes gracilis]